MAKKIFLSCLALLGIGLVVMCVVPLVLGYLRTAPRGNGVDIRVQNNMGADISDLWLGAGPGHEDYFGAILGEGISSFGSIENGEITRYRTVKNTYQYYGKTDLVVDGNRYFNGGPGGSRGKVEFRNIDPTEPGDPLPSGQYTFAYSPGDGSDVADLVITKDE